MLFFGADRVELVRDELDERVADFFGALFFGVAFFGELFFGAAFFGEDLLGDTCFGAAFFGAAFLGAAFFSGATNETISFEATAPDTGSANPATITIAPTKITF